MNNLYTSPLFAVALSFVGYKIGLVIYNKTKYPFFNPFVVGSSFVIATILILDIPVSSYQIGGGFIALFLGPVLTSIGYAIYKQWIIVKLNFYPLLVGTAVAAITSMISVLYLTDLFNIERDIVLSMVPKSATAAFSLEVSEQIGGIPGITMLLVIVTAMTGAILGPIMIKLFKIKNPVTKGIALGATSHAIGVGRALEYGKSEGALAGIAIGFVGMFTVILSILFL
jgi:putative effector of murein hydrolase